MRGGRGLARRDDAGKVAEDFWDLTEGAGGLVGHVGDWAYLDCNSCGCIGGLWGQDSAGGGIPFAD